jgi:DNA-binding CsgD family transcriptional regulator
MDHEWIPPEMPEASDGDTELAATTRSPRDISDGMVEHFLRRIAHTDRSPKVLIDGQGNVLWQSPEAGQLLQPPMPLTIRQGRVQATSSNSSRSWEDFLENLDESGDRMFLSGKGAATWVLAHGWAEQLGKQRLVFLKLAMSWPFRAVADSGLAKEFGLTKSECAVLDEFARLRKPAQIAERLHISVSTVRSHLKQIHSKMSVNSGVQLLRITRAYCDS